MVYISDVAQYEVLIQELEQHGGQVSEELSLRFAAEAFERTACYDATIGNYLAGHVADRAPFSRRLVIPLNEGKPLRYGENPHQQAALYFRGSTRGAPQGRQLQGAEL